MESSNNGSIIVISNESAYQHYDLTPNTSTIFNKTQMTQMEFEFHMNSFCSSKHLALEPMDIECFELKDSQISHVNTYPSY